MSDSRVTGTIGRTKGTGLERPELEALLEEIRDVPCASLFSMLAREIAGLDAAVQAEVRPLGVLFRDGRVDLCELSLYGELFMARIGPGLAVEVRVRNTELALLVLDRVLREHLRICQAHTETSPA